jgi:cell division protease FtsH
MALSEKIVRRIGEARLGPLRAFSAFILLFGTGARVSAQIVESAAGAAQVVGGVRGISESAPVFPLFSAAGMTPGLAGPSSVLVPSLAAPSALVPAASPLASAAHRTTAASAPSPVAAAPSGVRIGDAARDGGSPVFARNSGGSALRESAGVRNFAAAALSGLESRLMSDHQGQGAALDGFFSSSGEGPESREAAQAPAPADESSRRMTRAKRIEYLTALAKDHPVRALAHIKAVLDDPDELHMEILISALRLLGPMPPSETSSFLIHLIADSPHYYLRREAILMIAARPTLSSERREEALAALRQAATAADAPVRIAARDALSRFGVDPGPEIVPESIKVEPERILTPEQIQEAAEQAAKEKAEAEAAARPRWKKAADHVKAHRWIWLSGGAALAIGALIFHVYGAVGLTLLSLVAGAALFSWQYHRSTENARQPDKGLSIGRPARAGTGEGSKGFEPIYDRPTTRFSEVAGIDEAKTEIDELKDILQHPGDYEYMGAKLPKGVLLVGPPGTGKTLLARALAGEAGVPFYSQAGSDFVEQFVGVGASRVRVLFLKARQNAPAIIFIDEIDAIGGSRDDQDNSEWMGTLTAILKEVDGFDPSKGVLLIGATNRLKSIDEALRRRFSRIIYVGKPDVMGREAILQVHARGRRIGADVDLHKVAKNTPGLSGSYLENIVNEAATLATRDNKGLPREKMRPINQADFDEAIEKVMSGTAEHLIISPDEKKRLAKHEVGHLLLRLLLHGKAGTTTIIPRSNDGSTLGYSKREGDEEDRLNYTSKDLNEELVIAFGGLVSEERDYKDFSSGVVGDLEIATRVSRQMVTELGMGRRMRFGMPSDGKPQNMAGMSEPTKRKLDADIAEIKENAYLRATSLLNDPVNVAAARRLEAALLESETLSGEKAAEIAGVHRIAP